MSDNTIFYDHPVQGFNGDFIPFYHNGVFHLFMIINGSWEHLTTADFVNFENHGVALPAGDESEQDNSVCTGSVIEHGGVFHIFYAGYNGRFAGVKPIQVVLHATSADLYNWKKEDDVFLPPDEKFYHRDGWRDPLVYYDEKHKEFRMLITGAERHDHFRRWGCAALAVSKDLKNWKVKKPLYAPFLYDSHECPDIFKLGKKWSMIFSTYTRWWEVRYCVADSPDGPWKSFKDELLDNRSYYAAKTVSDGKRRFLVGWIARRTDCSDKNKYEWGGSLGVHETEALPDGELILKPVKEIKAVYKNAVPLTIKNEFGRLKCRALKNGFTLDAEGFGAASLADPGTGDLYVSFDLELGDNAQAGLLFRADVNRFDKWAMIEVDRKKDRLFFDHVGKWFDDQFFDEERPLLPAKKYRVELISKGSVVVAYCNGKALSARHYKPEATQIGLFVRDGKAKFTNVVIKTI